MVEHAINCGVLHTRGLHPRVTQRCLWTPHQPSMIKPSNPPRHLINCIYASPKALRAHQGSILESAAGYGKWTRIKIKYSTEIHRFIYTYMLKHTQALVCFHVVCAHTLLEQGHPGGVSRHTHTPLYLHVGSDYLYIHKPYKCSTHPARWQLRFSVIS